MKTLEILNVLGALKSITDSKRMVPTKFAYASAINRKRMTEVVEAFEAGRVSLVEKYGAKDEGGKLLTDDKGQATITDIPAFNAEASALGNTDHPELKLHQIPLSELPAEIEMEVMDALMPMIQEPAPAEASK
jgi:hypothetical protein